jgi:hypothetical protein
MWYYSTTILLAAATLLSSGAMHKDKMLNGKHTTSCLYTACFKKSVAYYREHYMFIRVECGMPTIFKKVHGIFLIVKVWVDF